MTAFFAEIPTPYALTFAGQGSAWRPALSTSLSFPPSRRTAAQALPGDA